MKCNPVLRRELTVGSRSIRLMAIFFIFNSILAVVALFNICSVADQVRITAEIQYSQFLDLYIFVSSVEFVMLLMIMPALTAGSISSERERQTLELMMTTAMEPKDIVLGKLASSMVTMLILAISALPIQAVVFVYGGITLKDIITIFFCYVVVTLLTGSIGMFYSSFLKRSTVATVCAYVTVIVMTVGTIAINKFVYQIALQASYSYITALDTVNTVSSGIWRYILLFNPAVSFYNVVNGQAGSGSMKKWIEPLFGTFPDNFVTNNWTSVSLIIQLVMAVIFILIAVWAIRPERNIKSGTGKKK